MLKWLGVLAVLCGCGRPVGREAEFVGEFAGQLTPGGWLQLRIVDPDAPRVIAAGWICRDIRLQVAQATAALAPTWCPATGVWGQPAFQLGGTIELRSDEVEIDWLSVLLPKPGDPLPVRLSGRLQRR